MCFNYCIFLNNGPSLHLAPRLRSEATLRTDCALKFDPRWDPTTEAIRTANVFGLGTVLAHFRSPSVYPKASKITSHAQARCGLC